MSSKAIPVDPQNLVSYISQSLSQNYTGTAGLAWYAYEYLLTLSLEVEVIWKSKPNLTIILFLINRYTSMLNWAIIEASVLLTTDVTICTIMASVKVVTDFLSDISVSGIFVLRTYAIYGRNNWVLGLLGLLFLSRLGLIIRLGIDEARQNEVLLIPRVDDVGNCTSLASHASQNLTAFDAIVFILTVSRTWTLSRQAKAVGIEASLSELLLRDGSLYFGLLSIMSVLEAIAIFGVNLPLFLFDIVQLSVPLQVILASRLVLNLRTHLQSNNLPSPNIKTDIFFHRAYGGSHTNDRFHSAIDSVLGNIGAPLRGGDDPEDGDDDEPQVPNGKGEYRDSTEDRVDPLSPETTRSRSNQAVNEGGLSEP